MPNKDWIQTSLLFLFSQRLDYLKRRLRVSQSITKNIGPVTRTTCPVELRKTERAGRSFHENKQARHLMRTSSRSYLEYTLTLKRMTRKCVSLNSVFFVGTALLAPEFPSTFEISTTQKVIKRKIMLFLMSSCIQATRNLKSKQFEE